MAARLSFCWAAISFCEVSCVQHCRSVLSSWRPSFRSLRRNEFRTNARRGWAGWPHFRPRSMQLGGPGPEKWPLGGGCGASNCEAPLFPVKVSV